MSFDMLPDVKKDISDIKTALTGLEKQYKSIQTTLVAHEQVHKRLTIISDQLSLSIKQQMNLMNKSQQVTQMVAKTTTSTSTKTEDFAKAVTDSVKAILEQKEAAKEAERAAKDLGHGLDATGQPITQFNKRTQLISTTIKRLRDEYGILQFDLSKPETFQIYKEEGGNRLEFLAEFISNSREEIAIFGFEAAKARKLLYGFAPPGTFRMLNKLSSTFQFFGGMIRRSGDNAEENNNILGNTLKIMGKLTKEGKGLNPFAEFEKGGFAAFQEAIKENNKNFKMLKPINLNKILGVDASITKEVADAKKALAEKENELFIQGIEYTKNDSGGTNTEFKKETLELREALEEALGKQKDAREKKIEKIKEIAAKGLTNFIVTTGKVIAFVFRAVMRYLVLGGMALIAIGLIATKILPTIIEHFSFAMELLGTFIAFMSPIMSMVFTGIERIINGFLDGDFEEILFGVGEFALGVLAVLATGFIALGYTLLALGVTFITGVFGKLVKFLLGGEKTAKTIFGRAVVLISAILLGIKIATLLNSPAFIAVAIMGVLFVALKWLAKKLDFFAEGGVSAGGLAVVGEKGPELVNLPRGSRVHSNADSRKMVGSGGSVVNNISVTINAKDTSKSEMRRIAKEIGNMINKEINRGVSSSTTR